MRLDPGFELVVDRPHGKILLEFLEGLLHFCELHIERPELIRVAMGEVGAQQIASFPAPHLARRGSVEREAKVFRRTASSWAGNNNRIACAARPASCLAAPISMSS